jgi:hypothetical protein
VTGTCARHDAPSVGACSRCGTFVCAGCNPRYQPQLLCLDCFARPAVVPEPARAAEFAGAVSFACATLGWMSHTMLEGTNLLLVAALSSTVGIAAGWLSLRFRNRDFETFFASLAFGALCIGLNGVRLLLALGQAVS